MANIENTSRTTPFEQPVSDIDRQSLPPQIHRITRQHSYVAAKQDSTEREIHFDTSEGFQPFGPPPTYTGDIGRTYQDYDLETSDRFLRERFGLDADSTIVFGSEGSNELLERVCMSLENGTTIWGLGPHFIGLTRSIEVANHSTYVAKSPALHLPLEDILEGFDISGKLPSAIYLANPDARGDAASRSVVENFIERMTGMGIVVIYDAALADFLPDSEFIGNLTSNNSHLIVLGSLSKGVGLPGEGLAYMISHRTYADEFKKQMRDHHYRGNGMVLMEQILRPEIIYPHLEMMRTRTQAAKSQLLMALEKNGIRYLPTSAYTPIVFVDGEDDAFYEELDIASTPGSGFFDTYERNEGNTAETSSRVVMSNRFVRIGLPLPKENEEVDIDLAIELIVRRIVGAKNVIRQTRLQVRDQKM